MKVNLISNISYKGIRINKKSNNAKTNSRQVQKDNIEQADKQIGILSKLLQRKKPKEIELSDTSKIEITPQNNGEDIYTSRGKEIVTLSAGLDEELLLLKQMDESLNCAIESNKKIEQAAKVPHNAALLNDSTKKTNDAKSFERIGGYEKELSILNQEFINKVIKEKAGDDSLDIPGSVLFFGPTRNGKTTITKTVAEATGCKLAALRNTNHDKLIKKLKETAEKSEEQFKKDRTRTIIFIDEIDKIASTDSKYHDEFFEFLKDCSNKYHCTVFGATNNPLTLGIKKGDTEIFPILMSIDPADSENKKAIISHFLKYYNADNLDIDSIVKLIEEYENDKNAYYDNEQIGDMAEDLGVRIQSKTISSNEALTDLKENILPQYKPRLSPKIISKFQEEYDILIKDCEGE